MSPKNLYDPIKSKANYEISYHPEKTKILYECPCDIDKKVHHHFDYNRPREVIKLCRSCHMKEHKRLRGYWRKPKKTRS